MQHQFRMIQYITRDVEIADHPSIPTGTIKVVPKPGAKPVEHPPAYGCKVCGVSMEEIIEHNLPCAGASVDDLLASWASDLLADGE